jgi:hypothetical protein
MVVLPCEYYPPANMQIPKQFFNCYLFIYLPHKTIVISNCIYHWWASIFPHNMHVIFRWFINPIEFDARYIHNIIHCRFYYILKILIKLIAEYDGHNAVGPMFKCLN